MFTRFACLKIHKKGLCEVMLCENLGSSSNNFRHWFLTSPPKFPRDPLPILAGKPKSQRGSGGGGKKKERNHLCFLFGTTPLYPSLSLFFYLGVLPVSFPRASPETLSYYPSCSLAHAWQNSMNAKDTKFLEPSVGFNRVSLVFA